MFYLFEYREREINVCFHQHYSASTELSLVEPKSRHARRANTPRGRGQWTTAPPLTTAAIVNTKGPQGKKVFSSSSVLSTFFFSFLAKNVLKKERKSMWRNIFLKNAPSGTSFWRPVFLGLFSSCSQQQHRTMALAGKSRLLHQELKYKFQV